MRFDLEEHPARRRETQWPHRIAVNKPASQTVHPHATDELAVNNCVPPNRARCLYSEEHPSSQGYQFVRKTSVKLWIWMIAVHIPSGHIAS